jgi:DNA-binding PadR family transcriptional regulator
MSRRPDTSPQTRSVLAALLARPAHWRHGYDLSRELGLKSGTLYPILVRLADRGLLETRWETPAGSRPPRQLYRISASGMSEAAALAAEPPSSRAAAPAPSPLWGVT